MSPIILNRVLVLKLAFECKERIAHKVVVDKEASSKVKWGGRACTWAAAVECQGETKLPYRKTTEQVFKFGEIREALRKPHAVRYRIIVDFLSKFVFPCKGGLLRIPFRCFQT